MATLQDIARLANVSAATVSRILNRDPNFAVAEQTLARVVQVAEQLHYIPVRKRAPMQSEKTQGKISVLVFSSENQEVLDPYFVALREGVERECVRQALGAPTVIRWFEDDHSPEIGDAHGLVVIGDSSKLRPQDLRNVAHVVFVDYISDPGLYDSVTLDFDHATKLVVDHLFQLGHKRIGYMGGTGYASQPGRPTMDGRHAAFMRCMKDAGSFDERHVHLGTWDPAGGFDCASRAIGGGDLPTAFFIGSDPMAIGALRAFRDAGIRVPQDIAVVGFDDVKMAAYMHPALTTVRTHPKTMGSMAVKMVLDQMRGRDVPVQISIPPQLIVRESCGAQMAGGRLAQSCS